MLSWKEFIIRYDLVFTSTSRGFGMIYCSEFITIIWVIWFIPSKQREIGTLLYTKLKIHIRAYYPTMTVKTLYHFYIKIVLGIFNVKYTQFWWQRRQKGQHKTNNTLFLTWFSEYRKYPLTYYINEKNIIKSTDLPHEPFEEIGNSVFFLFLKPQVTAKAIL